MSKPTTNNENDRFNNLFRQKLEQYKAPLKDELWDNIESKIRPAKKRFALQPVISVAAIALVLLGVFLWNPSNDARHTSTPTAESTSANDATIARITKENQVPGNIDKPSTTYETEKKTSTNAIVASVTTASDVDAIASVKESETPPVENREQQQLPVSVDETEAEVQKKAEKEPYERFLPHQKNSLEQADRTKTDKQRKKKREKRWQLAANYSTKNGIDLGVGNRNEPMMRDPSDSYAGWSDVLVSKDLISANPNNTLYSQARLLPEDFSQKTFLPTLSFGLMLRKDLSNHLGIESGLTYTCLQTRFFHNGINRYDAKSELHYLGIPLNLLLRFVNNSRWNVYLSAGGMIEKGLLEKFSQNIYLNNETCPDKRTEKIKGIQFSLNGALGVSYDIFDRFGIYLEPRISYYFDNDQPYSIRTEKAAAFGLNLGLKYSL
ncbi:MAG: PorT family protein [Prevotellaceae bacterium]|jgi:hypothetical protein|nr:PorT family protein [Prevotellaceae bacterium]